MSTTTSKPLKPKRGTTAQNNNYTGEAYEVTLDTDKKTLVVHDGLTAGGFPLARADEVAAKDAAQDAKIAEAKSSADAAKTTADNALPKSGGTMTGTLESSAGRTITGVSTAERLLFTSAPVWTDGAWLHLSGKDSTYNGNFQLSSRTANGSGGSLIGEGDVLTWCGKNIVRSVNGVSADAAGNVALKAVITETWRSGYSWYRKWSDGLIEQGGIVISMPTGANNITLPTPYTGKDSFISLYNQTTNNYTGSQNNGRCGRLSNSTIVINHGSATNEDITWFTIGY